MARLLVATGYWCESQLVGFVYIAASTGFTIIHNPVTTLTPPTMISGADANMIEMFFGWFLKKFARKAHKNLQPGLSPEAIAELTKGLKFELPEEVIFMYQTVNGLKSTNRLNLAQVLILDNGIMMKSCTKK